MDAATRYAREYLLARPAVVVLRAPTGYLKTSSTRIAAQHARTSLIVDCRELAGAEHAQAVLAGHTPAAGASGAVDDFVAFENAEAVLGKPDVLAAIHGALERRGARQTIAVCTRRPFPLPASVLADAVELTHDDLAVDVARELGHRGLERDRIAEIHRLTLGWPMATYRLAAVAAGCAADVSLETCGSRAYERLLQDVRLDFIDRLSAERRGWLLGAHRRDRDGLLARIERESERDLLASKLARAEGLLLRDGAHHRVPAIVLAALDATARAAARSSSRAAAAAEPEIVFDVLSGEITARGETVRLPRREFEVFANLAIKGRRVPYDVLLEEVWGDPDNDYAKLKVTVGRLRKRLGFGTIRSIGAGYETGANVTCTLAELEELTSTAQPLSPATVARLDALRLRYRRELAGTARSWRWYTAWSVKVDAFAEAAAIALGNHALGERRYAVALERAHDAIALDTVSQDAHELALRALVAQGNTVAARQVLAAYAATLRRTLGIPVPETLSRIVADIAS